MMEPQENMFDNMTFVEGLFVVLAHVVLLVILPLIGVILSVVMLLNLNP